MSIVHTEARRTYAAQRGVSQGASITLVSVSGGYAARFECATRATKLLGDRNVQGGVMLIPTEDMQKALTKLAESFSVALVDTTIDETGSRFVLVWLIRPTQLVLADLPEGFHPAFVVDANQGSLDLDEY